MNIPKDGICWISLYNLFQWFTSLTEDLFSHNIQSEFILLLLPIAVIHLCVCTSLLWQELLFLFSMTPHKVQKIAKRSQAASQLQAKVASVSLYAGTNHMYVRTYHVLKSNICLGGILPDSLQLLSLKGTEQDAALQVQPMDSRQKWLVALPQGCVPVSWPGCCPPYPTDYYCIASYSAICTAGWDYCIWGGI